MNKTILIIVIIIFISIAAFAGFTQLNNSKTSDSMMDKNAQSMEDESEISEDKMMKEDSSMMNSDSGYVEYSKGVFDNSSDKRRVLFFYANWCPTCRPTDANFRENTNKLPEDLVLIRVNYNDTETDQEEKDLAKKYGVTYQHTFVQIDGSGKEIAKWNGGQIEELLENIK